MGAQRRQRPRSRELRIAHMDVRRLDTIVTKLISGRKLIEMMVRSGHTTQKT